MHALTLSTDARTACLSPTHAIWQADIIHIYIFIFATYLRRMTMSMASTLYSLYYFLKASHWSSFHSRRLSSAKAVVSSKVLYLFFFYIDIGCAHAFYMPSPRLTFHAPRRHDYFRDFNMIISRLGLLIIFAIKYAWLALAYTGARCFLSRIYSRQPLRSLIMIYIYAVNGRYRWAPLILYYRDRGQVDMSALFLVELHTILPRGISPLFLSHYF